MQRNTREDYEKLAKSKGLKWLGPDLPESMLVKTRWQCLRDPKHVFEMRGANVHMMSPPSDRGGGTNSGRGCPYCSHRWRRTATDYHLLAKKHGVEWAGELPKSTRDDTLWRMPDGKMVSLSYRALSSRVTQLGATGSRKTVEETE